MRKQTRLYDALYKWKSLLSLSGRGEKKIKEDLLPAGGGLRPLKLASSLVKAISTARCLSTRLYRTGKSGVEVEGRASPSPPSTVLMKLSSGRVSRTNRRFNFLNALISPGWDTGPSLYIPWSRGSEEMRRCLRFQAIKIPAEGPQGFLMSRKKFLRGGEGGAHARATVGCRRHVSSRATRATWPSLPARSSFRLSSFLNCIITIIRRTEIIIYVRIVFHLRLGELNGSPFFLPSFLHSLCVVLSKWKNNRTRIISIGSLNLILMV